jgi:amidase
VPFVIKDFVIAAKGQPTRAGSRLMEGFVPDHDSELMARYRRAGFVTFAKTSTPEFGFNGNCEAVAYGAPTRNPWNAAHIAGGSSGGSAAAVAAGIVPVAHANDGGGSIRIPASCCGVFGLKPTRGRVPLGPDLGVSMAGLPAEHVVSRSVRDSAAALDATAGPDLGAPYWAAPPERPFLDEVGRPPGELRIAVTTDWGGAVLVHDDCRAAVADAAKLCRDLGHEVEEASPRFASEPFVEAWFVAMAAFMVVVVDGVSAAFGRKPGPDTLEHATLSAYEKGKRLTAVDLVRAEMFFNGFSREMAAFFARYDVLLTPTLATPPPRLGALNQNEAGVDALDFLRKGLFAFAPFCAAFNVTGQPAMSVPLYWNGAGLPVGVQFAARFGEEALLFRLAGQLEAARPWKERYGPLPL